MGLFNKDKSGDSPPPPTPDPKYRVEYTDENGPVSETAFSDIDAQGRADVAAAEGHKNITINPFKRGR